MLLLMTIPEAVRKLRDAYQESQQYFATRLKMSTSSVAYYEIGVRHPDLMAVLKFERAAEDIGREDLVKIFAQQVCADLGRFVIQADDELQHQRLRKVQWILSNDRFRRLWEPLMDVLAALDEELKPKRGKRKDTK
jgi:transcriptional regulator with XRE-family HTH domain